MSPGRTRRGLGRLHGMSFLVELAPGDARLGGKARSLAELAAAGLPTPPGFVIADQVFRALAPALPHLERLDDRALLALDGLRAELLRTPWPAGFTDELGARLGGMPGTRFAVRSSFATEDRPGRIAAGIFESRLEVTRDGLEQAVREVLASALAPSALAYALAHGEAPAAAPIAVLVHAFVAGEAAGSAALVPAAGAPVEPVVMVRRGRLPETARSEIGCALEGLAAARGAVEVEWVLAGGALVYLQARPFEPARPPAAWPGWAELGEGERAAGPWRWDRAHNPLPLSPAQAGLVELVDGACRIGIRQRVLGGYLFYRSDHRPLPPPIRCEDAGRYLSDLTSTVESRLAALGPSPALEAALDLFRCAYEPIFGVLQPALREAHTRLRQLLEDHAPSASSLLPSLLASVPSVASERLALARRLAGGKSGPEREAALASYLARFGDEAPAWDVAVPTYAEAPSGLGGRPTEATAAGADWRRARDDAEARLPAALHARWRRTLDLAREAVALGEADDWLYAKAQAAVRRALLALGRQLARGHHLDRPDDVFYLPLSLARALAEGGSAPTELGAKAEAGRRSWNAARRVPPPLPDTAGDKLVRGVGVGGRALGRVVWHRPGERPPSPEAVLVASTLLPTELPLISAAALVMETGGALDHVAAQARERGLPAVVGAQGAQTAFREGDLVLVDGDRGIVVALPATTG